MNVGGTPVPWAVLKECGEGMFEAFEPYLG
jgi:hypothetical protein